MRKLLLTSSAVFFLAPSASAQPYVSGSVGVSNVANSSGDYGAGSVSNVFEYKAGIPVNLAFGNNNEPYRVEVAVGYQSDSIVKSQGIPIINDTKETTISLMLNSYYDVDIKAGKLSSYLMAGIGGCNLNINNTVTGYSENALAFAWQAGGGIGIKAIDGVIIDLGYRYFKPSNSSWPKAGINSLTNSFQNISVGIRCMF